MHSSYQILVFGTSRLRPRLVNSCFCPWTQCKPRELNLQKSPKIILIPKNSHKILRTLCNMHFHSMIINAQLDPKNFHFQVSHKTEHWKFNSVTKHLVFSFHFSLFVKIEINYQTSFQFLKIENWKLKTENWNGYQTGRKSIIEIVHGNESHQSIWQIKRVLLFPSLVLFLHPPYFFYPLFKF